MLFSINKTLTANWYHVEDPNELSFAGLYGTVVAAPLDGKSSLWHYTGTVLESLWTHRAARRQRAYAVGFGRGRVYDGHNVILKR